MSGIGQYGRQFLDEADRQAVLEVLQGDFLTQGPWVPRFEEALCGVTGAKHAVAVSSGTAALHIAALAAGLQAGKASVTAAVTFVASANAALYCGAQSLLADIDPATGCLDPGSLAHVVKQNDAAASVVPVHLCGLSVGMREIRAVAGRRVVIEDACHALGALDEDGQPVGSCRHSDMAAFSFHPVKSITTGEGGAITTNDDELARMLRSLRNHGLERDARYFQTSDESDGFGPRPWYYEQQVLGFNYRMTDLQAALGCSQLGKLPAMIERRRALVRRYNERLAGIGSIVRLHSDEQHARSANHLYVVLIDFDRLDISRGMLMQKLREAGVGSQVHYIPVYRQPFHRDGGSPEQFPASENYYRRCLTLPLHVGLTESEVDEVVERLVELCGL